MPSIFYKAFNTVEATVTSKGQITLPSELRKRLGLQRGSRIRFTMPPNGEVKIQAVRYGITDLWKMADAEGKPERVMSLEEMNKAKVRIEPQ